MRALLSLGRTEGATLVESLVRSVVEVERTHEFRAALAAHATRAAELFVVDWSTVEDEASVPALLGRGDRPHLVVIAQDAEQASRAIAAGADDVLVATDQGFEVRLPFTIARARKARATHDEVSTLCAVASKHAVLRYLEIDLRSDRLVRVGEVEPSSRRLASSAIEGRLASETFDDVSHGNLIRGAADAISRFQQSGELSAVVVDVRFHRDFAARGTRRLFLTLAIDDHGHPTRLRGFSWDTTDLVDATRDYRQLFESAHDAIVIFEPDGEIVLDANRRACEQYGIPREKFFGSSMCDRTTNLARGTEMVAKTMASTGFTTFEVEQLRSDGSRMFVEINASRIEYQGRTAILSINRDVSARRNAEAANRRHEQALQETAKMEALGRLAGGIAHDFNNLLMVIATCSDVLRETLGPTHPARVEIDDIVDASERAKSLIARLLAFGRRTTRSAHAVDLGEVVAQLQGLLRRVVGEDVQLEADFADELPSVLADPGQLEQLIVNLVVNARDAIDGRGTISIRTEASSDTVTLVVSDTGCGMDEATRARIFEPFFTTKEPGKGTGLGLSTVYAIVRDSNASVSVESAPGKGSTFRIAFPIHHEESESVRRSRVDRQSQPGTELILLVEDERAVRRLLARELSRFGYRVIEAENGEVALEIAQREPVDVLVTDVVMPKMSGDELAVALKARWPDLKIVFMSGHTDRGKVRDVAERGLGPLLRKPFHPSELIDAVRLGLAAARPA